MPNINPEFETVVREIAPKNGEVLLENFRRMADAADLAAKSLIDTPNPNVQSATNEVEKLLNDTVAVILAAAPHERLALIHELNKKLIPLANGLGTSIEAVDISKDQTPLTEEQIKIGVDYLKGLLRGEKKPIEAPLVVPVQPVRPTTPVSPVSAPTPAPVVVPPVTPTPAPVFVPPVAPTPAPVVVPPVVVPPVVVPPVVVPPVAPTPAPVVVPPVAPTPAPVVVPPVAPTPVDGHEVISEAPTYERTRNYKSGHSKVRGVKPGFDDMPSIEAVKSRTLTGQVDIEGFDVEWREISWYKRFIEAATALKFCAPLMDKDTQAWIAEVQPAIDVFAGLKDVPKNKWKREIWKFVAVDRKANAPMIYAPGGALNFLLAFDRLLDVQPEVRVAALAGNAADLNKLNIAWIRMEKGVGKKRTERAKERRATVRTYAAVVGNVPVPVVLPAIGATVPPAPTLDPVRPVAPVQPTPQPPTPAPATQPIPPTPPTPGPVPPTPATAPGPAPAPDVNTYNPTMDTSPDKLKFGPNKKFLDQYMINDEYPEFVKGLKIFDDTDFKNFSLNPLVLVDPSKDDINESEIKTPDLDKWLDDLSKSDQEYWNQFGVDWSTPDDRQRGAALPLLQECFDNGNPKQKVLRLFDRLSTFKENFRFYFFDSKRPVALKLQKLYFWAGLRIFQYGKYMNPTFHNAADATNGGHYYTRLLLDGNWKTPLPADMSKWINVPNDFWEHADDAIKFRVLSLFRSMARQLDLTAANPATKAEAQKWLEDNKALLDANKATLDSLEP